MNYPTGETPDQETRTYAITFNTASVMALQSIAVAKNLTIQQSLYWALEVATYLLQVQQSGGQILIRSEEGETSAIEV